MVTNRKRSMLRHCLLLLFTLQTCLLAGQEENPENCSSLSFQKRMGGDLDDKGMAIRQTAFGEYLLAGFTGDLSSPETQDALLVKLDKHGSPVWGKTYGGSGKDHFSRLIIDRDGNYIALGATHSAHASGAMLAVKTDTTGNILWSREYFFGGRITRALLKHRPLLNFPMEELLLPPIRRRAILKKVPCSAPFIPWSAYSILMAAFPGSGGSNRITGLQGGE